MFNSVKKQSIRMESPESSEFHRCTPEPTSGPPNDSGYFTASPSPLCSEVPDSTSKVPVCGPSSSINFAETPIVTKKGSLKNKLLNKTVSKHSKDSEISDIVEERDQFVSKYCEVNNSDPVLSDEGSLCGSFCGLNVEESDKESSIDAPKSLVRKLSPDFGSNDIPFSSLFKSTKSKSRFPHDRLFAKKFKSNEVRHSTALRSVTGNKEHSLIGVTRLDFFIQLSEVGSFPGVISLILSFLPPKDLVNVCKVSHAWRKICVADPIANQRRLAFLRHFKQTKENISWNDFKQADQGVLSLQKEVFRDIQNIDRRASSSSSPSTPRSPPVSPSKVRFHRFCKLGGTLGEGAQLTPCPRCTWPSCAEPVLEQGRCQAPGCQYIFCLKCHCDAHPGQPCFARAAAGQQRRSKATCIGSMKSRRNLRRL